MTTDVDSSVLPAIIKGEPEPAAWARTLAQVRMESRLVFCEVVYAECSPALDTRAEFDWGFPGSALSSIPCDGPPIRMDSSG